MKKLFLTITTLFLGLFTIASCDINNPKPDKVKETETTQGNEKKEDKTNDKTEDKDKEKENTEDKDKEKENTEDKDKEKEPTTNDNGSTNSEQPSTDGTTSNGEQPSTSDNGTTSNGETSNEVGTGETSNEVGSGETGTNEKEPTTGDNENTTNEVGGSSESGSSESGSSESGSSESGITSDGRRTPEETARELAFIDKRYEIKKRLENDSKLDNSKEGIELARTIAPNWDMRYKTDLMGLPVDEFYLRPGTIERRNFAATHALNYGWQRINEERYN